jgi:hypothetical protein
MIGDCGIIRELPIARLEGRPAGQNDVEWIGDLHRAGTPGLSRQTGCSNNPAQPALPGTSNNPSESAIPE